MAAEAVRGKGQPRGLAVHGALILTQIIFGGGAIVGKFGVHGTNPVLFALIREGVSGPLIVLLACSLHPWDAVRPKLPDVLRLAAAGCGLFFNQLFYILGLKVSDPVVGSAWQPSQPVFTLALAVLVGYEVLTARRMGGILVAVAGAVFMVLYGASSKSTSLVGHVCFFLNCVGTSSYVIVTKNLVNKYPSIAVAGWAYLLGSCAMLVSCVLINSIPEALKFVCHDNDLVVQDACINGAWSVPVAMIWPLVYWIMGQSVLSYILMTWANKHANASVVSVYTVLQPCTSGLISALLILTKGSTWAKEYDLAYPGVQDLGVLAILVGLALLFSDPASQVQAPQAAPVSDSSCARDAALLQDSNSSQVNLSSGSCSGSAAAPRV